MKKGTVHKIALVTLLLMLAILVLGASGVGAQQGTQPQLVGSDLGLKGKLGEAIAKAPVGTGKGEIDPNAPRGAFGIPGAPKINYLVAILWAVWVGWIFSTVGAFGGIMAGVGHMTVYGLGDWVKPFKHTAPQVNKLLTDSIRTSNQFLVGLSSLLSTINYLRAKRLAWPLGLALGVGSIVGAVAIPALTGGKVSFSQYQGWFGLFVFVVGGVLLYETTPRGQASKKAAKEAARAFEQSIKEKKDEASQGIRVTQWGLTESKFTFFGVEFKFNPIWAFVGGVVIAAISAFLGVGGGFLYVPYLTSIVGLPMFVVAGTSAMAVLVSMLTSITTYITVAGAAMDWGMIGVELIGVFIGSMIGPRTQKYIPDIWLKRIFVLLALYVGLGYFSKGFFGTAWVPM
ncbi:sulfite exporter TauE/SafE family protein [Desulfofundulus thermocisternus]|uniref:sulfite exporter TauE/SafE family protein n=1 Tax=Desulfofundulus thermocisternus TaxID=42471 RepID=UPI00217DF294|nr:sulfite exporter TauE/SafE family protein [Desulfofundulus thermocisternus]MCS5694909.1 sulfite exporter TauE/SafE family protein [Desulfofundulus thermocisternus]